jgi:GR25 family glycosyltransferase involved in LPS biosynthesis
MISCPKIVINLPERTDRLESFYKIWPWNFSVSEGVKHEVPHSGCGLAHVKAIRKALATPEPYCLVVEDDAEFIGDFTELEKVIVELGKHSDEWDCVLLSVECDKANQSPPSTVVRVHPYCIQVSSTYAISTTTACLWSRSALPLLDEYERALQTGSFIPIDRFLLADSWDQDSWKIIEEKNILAFSTEPWKRASRDSYWNMPRVWICDAPVSYQLYQSDKHTSSNNPYNGVGLKHKSETKLFLENLTYSDSKPRAATSASFRFSSRRAFIGCSARDIEKSWCQAKKSLELIFSSLDDYMFVAVESNSSDDSRNVLRQFCSVDPKRRLLVELEPDSVEKTRPQRIARARNIYLDHLDVREWPILIVADIDDILEVDCDFKNQFDACFVRDDWDCVAANRRGPYYDSWALRSKALGITSDPLLFLDADPRAADPATRAIAAEEHLYQKVIDPASPWIPCESVFGGLAIYKTKAIGKNRYDGDVTCEHVSFNAGLRCFIVPSLISGGLAKTLDGVGFDKRYE